MYIIYGQKAKKDPNDDFPLNSQIRFLADLFDNNCWIFSMPGHLSRGDNASRYLDKLNSLVWSSPNKNKQYIGFGNSYHSYEYRNKYISYINNKSIENPSGFLLRNYPVSIKEPIRHNHSKVLVYYSWKKNNNGLKNSFEDGKLSLSETILGVFIDSINVKAVIVGSSNQSYKTYFSAKADKGEADIMLIISGSDYLKSFSTEDDIVRDIAVGCKVDIRRDSFVAEHEDFFKTNIISKTALPLPNNLSDEEYLKAIFKKCLEEELY